MGELIVDVANEPQCQVVIFGIDPAGTRQSTAQCRQRLPDIGRNFDTREEPQDD